MFLFSFSQHLLRGQHGELGVVARKKKDLLILQHVNENEHVPVPAVMENPNKLQMLAQMHVRNLKSYPV